ncbi:MAG: DegT/DnrJ/EryC1/StrS family aminotransferase [Candidatus Omnitrophota bacterium]
MKLSGRSSLTGGGKRISMKDLISVGDLKIGSREKKAINKVLVSGRISEGEFTKEFEKAWAGFIGVKYCLVTSSGSGALITALTALKYLYNLKERPKVITSPLTYIADASALSVSGFDPVFVDIDPETFCITPENIRRHLCGVSDAERYSIILPVDLAGYCVKLDRIKKVAKEFNLLVLEDAAQAHGSIYQGRKCGSGADAGIFSFYIAHNIQAGEMGAITTNNHEIYRLAKKIKAQGRLCECRKCTRREGFCPQLENYKGKDDFDPRFTHDIIGYNFKAMEFQSALALCQMEKIEWIIKKRRENVKYLNEHLEKYSAILQLPLYLENVSYLMYPLVIKDPVRVARKELRLALEKNGIETRVLFGCIPTQQPAYKHLLEKYKGKLPNAEYVGKHGLYIGCHQYLTQRDLEKIVKAFGRILG